jgi:hypothetical protein
MTKDDAIVTIVTALPMLTQDDVRGFLACSGDEQKLIIQSYKDSGKMPGADGWQIFIAIIKECVDLANLVIPITGAVQGVFGIITAIK